MIVVSLVIAAAIALTQGCVVNSITGAIFPDRGLGPAYDNYTAAMGAVGSCQSVFLNMTIQPIAYTPAAGGVNNTSLSDLSGLISAEIGDLNDDIAVAGSYGAACDRAAALSQTYRTHLDAGSDDYSRQQSIEKILENQSAFARSEKDGMTAYLNALTTINAQLVTMEDYDEGQGFTFFGFGVYDQQDWQPDYMRAINKSYMYDMINTIRPTVDNYIAMDNAMDTELDQAIGTTESPGDVSLFRDMEIKFSSVSQALKDGYNARVDFYRNFDDSGLYLEKID